MISELCGLSRARIVTDLVSALVEIDGIEAIVLGGSYARGRARPDSDIDLGILYRDSRTFSIDRIRELAQFVDDTGSPVVSGYYEWGPWVNGGAWLTIGGQRVDFLYRSIDKIESVFADARAGQYEVHYLQQPPFGFMSVTYLGEVRSCVPLSDPNGIFVDLKREAASYPDALRTVLIRDFLFMAGFNLNSFASKFVSRGDSFGSVACFARAVNEMATALFAANRTYPVNDKTLLDEIDEFPIAPERFAARAREILSRPGSDTIELTSNVDRLKDLLSETTALVAGF